MRFIKRLAWIVPLAAALLMAVTLTPAMAATPGTSLGNLDMRVQLPDSVVLVSGQLNAGTSLPTTIALPVPSGVTPYWVGEILGGDPSADPKVQYIVKKAKGYDLIVFGLTHGRSGQVEYKIPALTAGIPVAVSYSLPIATRVTGATLSITVPVGATVTSSTGGTLSGAGSTGQTVTRTVASPKVGAKVSASVSFTPAGVTGPGTAGSTPGTGVAPLSAPAGAADSLVLPMWILVIVLGGLFARDVYKRRAASAHEPEPSPAPAPARKRARSAEPADEPAQAPKRTRAPAARPTRVARDEVQAEDDHEKESAQEWSGFDDADAPPAPKARTRTSTPRAPGDKRP